MRIVTPAEFKPSHIYFEITLPREQVGRMGPGLRVPMRGLGRIAVGSPAEMCEQTDECAALLREWTLLAFRNGHLRIGNKEDSQLEMLKSSKSVSIKAILKEYCWYCLLLE